MLPVHRVHGKLIRRYNADKDNTRFCTLIYRRGLIFAPVLFAVSKAISKILMQ